MMQLRTALLLITLVLLCAQIGLAQGEVFARRDILNPPAIEPAGFGEIVTDVDFDGDGKTEIYAVNTNWNDTAEELIPRIYKYEWSGTAWDSVWSAVLSVPAQNTWPALTAADLDNDGKMEIVWGPVNFLNAATNPNPVRIAVFEEKGDGSDEMGIAGTGNFRPNAEWEIADTAMVELRPFRWVAADVDGDDTTEVIFCDRASSSTGYRFGVISVNNIPDNGDGSETWRLEFSGKGQTVATGTLYDLAVVDSTIYFFHNVSAGTVTPVRFRNGAYSIGTAQAGVVPSGAWKSAEVVDLDNDGTKEIVIGSTATGSANNNVYLLQVQADTLVRTAIANLALGPDGRIYGGEAGDIDNDGNLDFVYGSRAAAQEGTIKIVKYLGGSITSPSSYMVETADKLYHPTEGGRYDLFGFTNIDADADQEVIYGHGIGSRFPLVTLDRIPTTSYFMSISAARLDANADRQPDNLDDTVQVVGIINSTNVQTTNFGYFMQDDSAGIQLFSFGLAGVPTLAPGYRVLVTGTIEYFRGTTEITPLNVATDVVILDTGNVVSAVPLTIGQYKADPEKYESRRITLAVAHPATFTQAQWPAAGSSANLNIWDGRDTTILRVDSDTEVDGSPYPTFPVRLSGVATQFTSAVSVHNDGYQVTPFFIADFVPVNAPPSSNIALISPAEGSELWVADSTQTFDFVWHKAIDFNNDALIYQFKPVAFSGSASNNGGADTVKTVTGTTLLGYLGANDSLAFRWTVLTKDPTNPIVASVDTFSLMLRKFTATPGWAQQTSGVSGMSLRSVKAISPMVAWMAGQAGTVIRTIDGGATWQSVGGGPISTSVSLNNIEAINDQVAFVINQPDTTNMYRTTNGGQTWERVYFDARTGAFLDAVHMYDAMNGIAIGDPVGGKWVILATTDGGGTWNPTGTEPTQVGSEAGWLNSLAVIGTTHIWFGTSDSRIYRSTDGGATWTSSPTTGVSSYSVWFNDTQFGVAGFSNGTAEVSTDGGATWTPAAGLPTGTGTVFGITGFGKDFWLTRGTAVYRSTDRGVTWTSEAASPGGTLRHIHFVKSGSFAAGWTGTSTGNILAFSGILTGVKELPSEVPVVFALEQNYPNPFNPSTTIRYSLPTESYVSVRIYDVLGREVATLLDQNRGAGVFEVVWNGENSTGMKVASGMYIYRMEARPSDGSSPFVNVKKMMMLK